MIDRRVSFTDRFAISLLRPKSYFRLSFILQITTGVSGFGRNDKEGLNFDTQIEFSHQLPLELTTTKSLMKYLSLLKF
jgi:hypothetical protein